MDAKVLLVYMGIYGIIVVLGNLLFFLISVVREKVKLKKLGLIDVLSSVIMAIAWSFGFNDSIYVPQIIYWIGFVGISILGVVGIINFMIGCKDDI